MEPTEVEKRKMIALALEVGVKVAFKSHLYQFGGKTYLQKDGGPIGVRLSGAVSRIVMGEWDSQLLSILDENNVKVWLSARYVDDITLLLAALKLGYKWNESTRKLEYKKEWEEKDRDEDLSDNKRTMEEVKKIMNSIYPNIQATMEVPDNFPDGKMPILDLKCWVENPNEPVKVQNLVEEDSEEMPDLDESFLSVFNEDEDEYENEHSQSHGANLLQGDGAVKSQDHGQGAATAVTGELQEEDKDDNRRGRLLYTFYEKEMTSKFAILKNSALAENTKVSSLTQDLVRRMKNTSEYLNQNTRNEVVDSFCAKLLFSGYKPDQIRRIAIAGLKGYESILKRSKEGKGVLHKSAKEGEKARHRKKLLGKSTWFKQKEGGADLEKMKKNSPSKAASWGCRLSDSRVNAKPSSSNHSYGKVIQPSNVLFVPQTPGGGLALMLRQAEAELSLLCGGKVKIVERGGTTMRQILHQTNPWSEDKCDRMKCLPCSSKEEDKPSRCRQRNIVYKTSCKQCHEVGKDKMYIGESARTSYERGREHLEDYQNEKEDSHMHKHFVLDHPQDKEMPRFTMKVMKAHHSALSRQIHEAVLIQLNEDKVLNSKGQYNRCQLPRLTVRMGERVIEDRKEVEQDNTMYLEDVRRGDKRENETEENYKANPSKRRKMSDKVTYRVGEPTKKQQKRKRQLIEEDIFDERTAKSPRKVSVQATCVRQCAPMTNTKIEQKQSSTKQLPISNFFTKLNSKEFSTKTNDQKSLPATKISEKNVPGKSHQKQAEAKLSLSSTKPRTTQPKPKRSKGGQNKSEKKLPFKFKPLQDYFKSLGTNTTPTENNDETKEEPPKTAETSPEKSQ